MSAASIFTVVMPLIRTALCLSAFMFAGDRALSKQMPLFYMCISRAEWARFKKAFGKTEADGIGNTYGSQGSSHTSSIREGQKEAIIGVWQLMKGRLGSSDHA